MVGFHISQDIHAAKSIYVANGITEPSPGILMAFITATPIVSNSVIAELEGILASASTVPTYRWATWSVKVQLSATETAPLELNTTRQTLLRDSQFILPSDVIVLFILFLHI